MLSPAKINLGLKILFKRPDGFHELQSIFLKLDFGDEISFEKIEEGRFELETENNLKGKAFEDFQKVSNFGNYKDNLLYKTFSKVQTIKKTNGVRIKLIKNIPTGGGLGGGSSNSASLLKYLFPEEIPPTKKVIELASSLGADVPFFLFKGHKLVGGIGDKFEDIEISKGFGILVSTGYVINTGEAFSNLKKPLQKDPTSETWKCLQDEVHSALRNGDWNILSGKLSNDFEEFALNTYPDLRKLKHRMVEFGLPYVSMTGSGSSFYGLSSSKTERDNLLLKLRKEFREFQFTSFCF
ncbi:MAG: 4-(cytidine 5'-diphospho)-2-C-methyl-D-erythritol kinase [Leptospiraceae bacterium]|nr:4-(cytidine 5'-diphospho)-2-C-methyl-D-erythritol kinase [Leptospiraceae bacterium]